MISHSLLARVFFSIYLGVSCVSGLCAGTNGAAGASPAIAAGGALADNNNLKPDSARKLSHNDVISVTVYQEDDLALKSAIIDENGMVMLPLLGQVKISGMTIGEATELIQKMYDKDYLVNPQVNLIVEKFAGRRFTVGGQVQRPGSFDFPQNETVNLLDAIDMAGSYTRLAAPKKVTVRRIENGAPKIFALDAEKMAKDPSIKPFEILPGDNIYVDERNF